MDTSIPLMSTSTDPVAPVRTYVQRVNRLLLSPARFFREDLPALSLTDALAFGLVSAWLASALAFAFETMNSFLLSQLFERWVQKFFASEDGFSFLGLDGSSFLYTAALLVLGPFLYLLQIAVSTVFLYIFASLLVEENPAAPEPVTFKGVMKIEAAAFASHWFAIVPLFGGLIAFVANVVLRVTGLRERFGVSTRRASVIVLAPYVFLSLVGLLLAALFLLAVFQFPYQDFLAVEPGQLPI